jgi:excisionase family DNA binding protein
MFNDYKDIVGVEELCKMLGIGKNKAYELLKNKAIKSIKIGQIHKIPKSNVIEFISHELKNIA